MGIHRLPRVNFRGLKKLTDAWAALVDLVEWNAAIRGSGVISVDYTAGGPVVKATLPRRMRVKLTGSSGSGAYTATEVIESPGGGFAAPAHAWAGTVYEWNGNSALLVDGTFRVEVELLSGVSEWRFQAGTCS